MLRSRKSKAEEQFAATQKKDKQVLKEKEKAQLHKANQMANLRALRLAKEAEEKEAADKEAADKAATKKRKVKS